jgi:hypothetical protein
MLVALKRAVFVVAYIATLKAVIKGGGLAL